MRTSFSVKPIENFLQKALQFADKDSHVVYFNPNEYEYPYGAFPHILTFGLYKEMEKVDSNNFNRLQNFINDNNDWAFGYFTYELKNELEVLESNNPDNLNFPLIHFFIPKHIIFFHKNNIEIHSVENPEELYLKILQEIFIKKHPNTKEEIKIIPKFSKEEYLNIVKSIQEQIHRGEIYETNFCQEYYAREVTIKPLDVFWRLNKISPMPFSSYVKHNQHYLICASPERFLKKEGNKLISQPIKGTERRDANHEKDKIYYSKLKNSPKEQSENIMIVDLVRNDLSRTAKAGTVITEERCKVYSFPNVHQMISTITAELPDSIHPVEAIKQAFPMGSMTGAPKIKAMQLIEKYENTKRGLFSGSVGYFTPQMDFDFNVVIRSILYNSENKYLSFQAGSAITYYSDAEKEYEECNVKTKAIREVISSLSNEK